MRRGIVGVEHRPVVHGLVREDPRLRRRVLGEVDVVVEMVGREIEQHRNPRTERFGRLQLKAARFDDVDGALGRLVDLRAQRVADVAADENVIARFIEHPARQRRRRRFPLRSRDRDDPAA